MRAQAQAALDQKQFAQAAALYRKLVEAEPQDGGLWMSYSQAARSAGQPREALAAAEKAVKLGTWYRQQVAYGIARGFAQLGAKDSALAWLEKALAWQFTPRTRMQTDSAFLAFREDERFRELAGFLPRRTFSRGEGWRYDLAFLDHEAKRLHASFRREAFSPEFEAALKQISDRVPQLTDRQMAVELERLIVLLHDGHSWARPPADARMLPIELYLFSDGLFVIGGVGEGKQLAGSQVVRFGPRSTEELFQALPAYVSHDNLMGVKWLGPWTLTVVDFLQALGGTDNPDRATLTLRDRSGAERTVTLDGGPLRVVPPFPMAAPFASKLSPPGGPGQPPLWLRRVATPYWFTAIPESHAVYFQFNQVLELPGQPTVAQFASTLRRAVSDPSVKSLIVDVRHNSGGNSNIYPPLLRVLSYFQESAPDHRIFYLAGRNTFSAAQNFSTNVERLTNAIFVGEPTGASPNFVGEGPNLFELPYSRAQVSISNWYHQFSFWSDTRSWIAPAIPVELSSADYFANRDPVLDAVLALIRAGGK